MKHYSLLIFDDSNITIKYNVIANPKIKRRKTVRTEIEGKSIYDFDLKEGATIKIYKENPWEVDNKVILFLMYLFMFDISTEYTNASENLPLEVDMEYVVSKDSNIELFNIVKTSEKSILRWKRAARIQRIMILAVIAFVSTISVIVIPKIWMFILIIIVIILSTILNLKVKEKNEIMELKLKSVYERQINS